MLNILRDIHTGKTFVDLGDYPTVNCGLIESLKKGAYIDVSVVGVKSNGFHDEPNRFRCKILTRGIVASMKNTFDNEPLWLIKYPCIDDIPVMDSYINNTWYGESTWTDSSWHNDTCPSFESFDIIDGKCVKIWSENKKAEMRELDDMHQYEIHICELDSGDEKCCGEFIETVLRTNDKNDVFDWILAQETKNEFARRAQVLWGCVR